jgi:hypothetical protein
MKTLDRAAAFAAALTLAVPTHAAGVDRREHRQQARIAQGVATGALTPRETARLERKEARVHRHIERARADGGGLSPAERARIQRHQDRVSRQIYREKHDGQRIP